MVKKQSSQKRKFLVFQEILSGWTKPLTAVLSVGIKLSSLAVVTIPYHVESQFDSKTMITTKTLFVCLETLH